MESFPDRGAVGAKKSAASDGTPASPAAVVKTFPQLNAGLGLLMKAHAYARHFGCSPWDFAVEIKELRKVGLTNSDFRWLVGHGFVEHGRDVSQFGAKNRSFRRDDGLIFGKKTCFVLTEAGVSFAQAAHTIAWQPTENKRIEIVAERKSAVETLKPVWDRDRQELRLGSYVVKQFKVPAPNQEIVLAVFHEEGWPIHIDDPLPPHCDIDPKRRLHDTINSLNRNQKIRLMQFCGDGSGRGVRWERLPLEDAAIRAANFENYLPETL